MEFNLADLFEHSVDNFGDREYLVADGRRRTYAEMDARANRLAHHLADQGIGPGDHVGIYGVNSVEWVESLWAIFKLRAVWININYRYVEDELAYLFGNADLKALIHDAAFTDRVEGVAGHMPDLRHRLVIGHDYEDALADRLARAGLRPPVGRRPLHPLHGRHDRHAQGRGVAPRRRAVRAGRRHRHPLRRSGPGAGGPGRPRQEDGLRPHVPAHRAAHARRDAVGGDGSELPGEPCRAHGPVRPARGVAPGRGRGSQLADDDGRRHGPSAGRGAGRRTEQGPGPVVAGVAVVDRRHLLAVVEGPVPRPLPEPGHHRRRRVVGGRRQRHRDRREGQDGHARRPDRVSRRRDGRARRRPPAGRARLRRHRTGRPQRRHPRRVLRRPGQDGRDLRRGRRHPVRHPRRSGHGRGRRLGDAARARLAVDQLRRREDLPRGGGGGGEVAPGRVRRRGGGRARRTLGPAGRGGGAARGPVGRPISRRCRTTAARRSRATRCRGSCIWSIRCSARRAARRTTPGRRGWPRRTGPTPGASQPADQPS